MKRKLIAIILFLSILGLMVMYLFPNVIKMYACAEGGGQWSWRKLECKPYQDSADLETIGNEKNKTTQVVFSCNLDMFKSFNDQADSLISFLNKAVQATELGTREKWEQKFFCAFPNSFKGIQAVFGYEDENGAAPLYDYPKGGNVIQYFSQLESIPDSTYYDKYVRINIDGIWEADNIREAFDFADRLTTDTENACRVLSTFSDNEIKSVFHFIFDGPHPKNEYNEKLYKSLNQAIESQDERLSRLLTDSYEKLMAEDDGHGH